MTEVEPTDLLGTWTLSRVIDDRLAGERRDVRGTTTLERASPDRVRWSEEGTMTWSGRSVPVSRTLFVDRLGEGWFVRFSDDRPFHPWSVGSRVDHPCAPDHYSGLIETDGDPVVRWTVEWRATGPEKDYVMSTVHSERRPGRHPGR
jgi:Family of unknown function (DUF6314)